MELFGWTVTRTKALPSPRTPVRGSGGWFPLIREPYTGAWQQNVSVETESILSYAAVFACVTLIASDIAKLRLRLVEQNADGIWVETESPAFSPVLRKPNRYQTRIKFIEQWLTSKLIHGNTYVLKQRDARGLVTALYVLDPRRVTPLVAQDGSVYYQLARDELAGVTAIEKQVAVPAREMIHDLMVALFHPLIGVSPIYACSQAAMQGLAIQDNSTKFFQARSQPGGVLTAPGAIGDETAKRLKDYWDANFTGENVGKVAVLGDGLKYEAMSVNPADAQLIEQLKWTAETVCSTFHVPAYMIGIGPPPTYTNIEALNVQYYAQCLQSLIESLELSLDEGLGLPPPDRVLGTEFDLDDLLRMDTPTKVKAAADGVGSGAMSPDEARYRYLDLGTVAGGDTPYLQQQYFSLKALAERDAAQPFMKPEPAPTPEPEPESESTGLTVKRAAAISRSVQEVLAHG
jgi:HK97 family phage portal protein